MWIGVLLGQCECGLTGARRGSLIEQGEGGLIR